MMGGGSDVCGTFGGRGRGGEGYAKSRLGLPGGGPAGLHHTQHPFGGKSTERVLEKEDDILKVVKRLGTKMKMCVGKRLGRAAGAGRGGELDEAGEVVGAEDVGGDGDEGGGGGDGRQQRREELRRQLAGGGPPLRPLTPPEDGTGPSEREEGGEELGGG